MTSSKTAMDNVQRIFNLAAIEISRGKKNAFLLKGCTLHFPPNSIIVWINLTKQEKELFLKSYHQQGLNVKIF